MKIAVFVCGVVRQMDIAYQSWGSLLKLDADWYLSTWNLSCESFSEEIYETPPLPPINFKEIKISDYHGFKGVAPTFRSGINSKRFIFLMSQFKEVLSTYDKIIILRPDTFLGEYSNFNSSVYLNKFDVISTGKYNNFIQDLVLIVSPAYFLNFSILQKLSDEQEYFNPHQEILKYCSLAGLTSSADFAITATLVRPTSRKRVNPSINQVAADRKLWHDFIKYL